MSTAADAGHPAGFIGIDIQNPGVGLLAANEGDMENVWNPDVVDKLSLAAQKRRVLDPVEAVRLMSY